MKGVAVLVLPTLLLMVIAYSFIQLSVADVNLSSSSPTQATDARGPCDSKCEGRCARAGYKERCLNYCNICCSKCRCVPSGTYGNKHECPCYRDLKDNKGRPKCP
ncbi:unnamed protein product [Linum grandiflorum]